MSVEVRVLDIIVGASGLREEIDGVVEVGGVLEECS